MKKKSRYTLMLAVCLLTSGVWAGIEGWGLGVGVFDEDVGVQGRKDFTLGKAEVSQISLQGSVFFHNKTTFRFDANYHHILNPESSFKLYPLAGAEFSVNKNSNRWGVNLGGGLNIKITEHNDLFVELKYVFGDWNGFGLMAGVHF